jgi:Asp-tRNA(Asn)/Glu-tRNA(Gln) amidotransferase A subunit family amidase
MAVEQRLSGDEPVAEQAALEACLAEHGIVLTPSETESVRQLAQWMSEGIAKLPSAMPMDMAGVSALDLSLFEQGAMLRDGRLTAVVLTQACLDRIGERDGAYRAFYHVTAERALREAAQADADLAAGIDRGPLHGIPVALKDMIDMVDVPTTANAPGRRDALAKADALVVRRLVEAGAVLVGKVATYEWGTVGPDGRGLFPPARNPWSLEHITGGSSSGSAVAVAGGLVRTSIGSDTGGSVRGPAFYCGAVGLKPTFGLVPKDGVLGMSPSMDHVGPISATVAEAAVTLDVIASTAAEQSAARLLGQPIAGLRIGYARDWFANDPQTMPAVLEAMDGAMSTLSQLGAVITEVELPDYHAIEAAAAAILHKESFDFHAAELRDHPEDYGRRAFVSLATGVAVSDSEVAAARQAGLQFRRRVDAVLREHDAIVTVGTLTTALLAAPFEKEAVWTPMRTIGFNVSGHPVLAMPVGFHQGLPMGMQIIGRHGDEARIVQIGDAFERATDHSAQRPPAVFRQV